MCARRQIPGEVPVDRRRYHHQRHLVPRSVLSAYWISSKTSLRCTTAPGVAARFSPTTNFGCPHWPEARRRRHVPQQVPRPVHQVGAPIVDRHLQRGRVGPQEVRRRQRVGDIPGHEPQLPVGGPVQLSVADQLPSGGHRGGRPARSAGTASCAARPDRRSAGPSDWERAATRLPPSRRARCRGRPAGEPPCPGAAPA